MYQGLKDKVIVLTGASGLIGASVAERLRLEGAVVVAVDIIAREFSESIEFIKLDITIPEKIDYLCDFVIDKYGRIDGLANLSYPRTADWGAKFEEIKYASWQANVEMQLNATFYLCQKVLEQMKKQTKGAIVNFGSIYGVVGNDFTLYEEYGGTSPAAYAAIKGGIINFSRYLASYYGKYDVRVNCVSPGGIIDKQEASFITRYESKVPLRRLGRPGEIAPTVCFLLSEDSSYITGHNLIVDGGWTAI